MAIGIRDEDADQRMTGERVAQGLLHKACCKYVPLLNRPRHAILKFW